ncbi:MAG: lipopolysaccharide biosynthesis protein [Lachnospiraceae bacterium]|nr:lipopolysaccharide biosynthesis protein [Candidatus Darwinimomas equi]
MAAENNENGNRKIISGLLWKLLELGGTQGIQLVVSIILARILSPEEFGTISLITIFITIANTFVQSGFATSLVQKKDVYDDDYSSVLWVSLLFAAVMYAVLFFAAPFIAEYYSVPVLTSLIRVTGIILFPGALVSIQTSYVSRNMQFNKLFIGSLVSVIVSGAAAIIMAARGFGVWAMSAQQIVYYFIMMFVMLIIISWKPKFVIVFSRVKEFFGFGWKILTAGLIDTIWTNVYGLVIGKRFSTAELGGYNRGEQFPKLIATNLGAAVQAVMLPVYSKSQDNKDDLKSLLQATVKYSSFVLLPMMAGLAAVARPMISLLLTDKWLFCVPYLQILAVSYAFYPIHTANLQAINAQGRSDLFLKLEIIKKISGILFLVIGLRFGIIAMLILKTVNEVICAVINSHPNKKLLGYGFISQIKDILPEIISSAIMYAAVFAVTLSKLNGAILLLIQIITGIAVYLLMSLLINRKTLKGFKDGIMKIFR